MEFEEFKNIYDREVVKQMRDQEVPGFSVLIKKEGEIVYDRSYGLRQWKNGLPANKDTLYGIASITKSMTALAILQLHEAGKLSIADPISKYIPVQLNKYPDKPILIKHLMSHSSGLPNLGAYEAQIKTEELTKFNVKPIPMGNWEDFYFNINDVENWMYFEPETRFFYNNDGFAMLSQIIEMVSGMSYEDYITENILNPLKMTRSTFSREDLENDENAASGYSSDQSDEGVIRRPKPHLSGKFQSGAGGLNSSVQELTNYLEMHLNGGEFAGNRILGEELLRKMYEPHNKLIRSESLYIPGESMAYGYGLSVSKFLGYTLIQHGGASGVAGGVIAFIPELKITYTHLYNVGWLSGHMMHVALCYLIGKDPYEEIPYLKRREHLNKLLGQYTSYKNQYQVNVKFSGGLLAVESDVVSKTSIILVPVNEMDVEPMEFYQYGAYGRLLVVFTEISKNEIILEIERNIYKKNSYIDNLEPFK